MIDNYFNLRTKVRKLKARYKELTIEEKIDLMSLELKLEGKDIKLPLYYFFNFKFL